MSEIKMANGPQISSELLSKFSSPLSTNSHLLSFEGIEGSGKSTQIQLFKENLESDGHDVLLLREPGGTAFGEILRSAILSSEVTLEPLAEAMLMASSRAQLLRERILPHLEKENAIVIVDRYIDSSIAYQGHARKLGIDKVLELHQYWPLCNLPHLSFYLKIDLELSLERQRQRGNDKDYFESKGIDFYQNLIEGYNHAEKIFPGRIKIIDGADEVDTIQKSIWSVWTNYSANRSR